MKRSKNILFLLLIVVLLLTNVSQVEAQCAMCSKAAMDGIAEGNTTSAGINKGILLLLGMPYLLVMAIGGTWWYRRKQARLAILTDENATASEMHL